MFTEEDTNGAVSAGDPSERVASFTVDEDALTIHRQLIERTMAEHTREIKIQTIV